MSSDTKLVCPSDKGFLKKDFFSGWSEDLFFLVSLFLTAAPAAFVLHSKYFGEVFFTLLQSVVSAEFTGEIENMIRKKNSTSEEEEKPLEEEKSLEEEN